MVTYRRMIINSVTTKKVFVSRKSATTCINSASMPTKAVTFLTSLDAVFYSKKCTILISQRMTGMCSPTVPLFIRRMSNCQNRSKICQRFVCGITKNKRIPRGIPWDFPNASCVTPAVEYRTGILSTSPNYMYCSDSLISKKYCYASKCVDSKKAKNCTKGKCLEFFVPQKSSTKTKRTKKPTAKTTTEKPKPRRPHPSKNKLRPRSAQVEEKRFA